MSGVPSRRARRLKLAAQLSAAATFLALFLQAFTGMCIQSFTSLAMLYGDEPFMAAMLPYRELIHGFHRWAGPGMAITAAVMGISMILLRRESRSLASRLLLPLGVVVLVLSLFAIGYSHVTGLVAGPKIRAVEATGPGQVTLEGLPAIPGEPYIETVRPPERQEVFEHHTSTALWLLMAATAVQVAGVVAVGVAVPRVRREKVA